jgi:polar amino acid transport system permease protein
VFRTSILNTGKSERENIVAFKLSSSTVKQSPVIPYRKLILTKNWREFPWWFPAMLLIALWVTYLISTQPSFREAFGFIIAGIGVTITTTLSAYLIAIMIGLIAGLGRISENVFFKNLATLYVEFIRGVPMLVLIFFIALVAVPSLVDGIKLLGVWLNDIGLGVIGATLSSIENKEVSMNLRAVVALSVTYGAFLAEIFRAGIESINRGQMEAARSQGLSYWQSMRYIILPQAIRNVLPALGNDFVSMLKDSSLVSILAVRDITQVAKLYAGHSFRFQEAYTILAVMYLSMTLALSMLMKFIERRYRQNESA